MKPRTWIKVSSWDTLFVSVQSGPLLSLITSWFSIFSRERHAFSYTYTISNYVLYSLSYLHRYRDFKSRDFVKRWSTIMRILSNGLCVFNDIIKIYALVFFETNKTRHAKRNLCANAIVSRTSKWAWGREFHAPGRHSRGGREKSANKNEKKEQPARTGFAKIKTKRQSEIDALFNALEISRPPHKHYTHTQYT